MPIPTELLNRKFERSGFSGYKAADIDAFMQELSTAAAKENREVAELQHRLQEAQRALESYKDMEESIKNAMLSAQRLADQTKKDAKAQADSIIREAELKAQKIVKDAGAGIEFRKQEANRIKQEVVDFRRKMMGIYREHLELLSTLPAEDEDVVPGTAPAEPGHSGNAENTGAAAVSPAAPEKAPAAERPASAAPAGEAPGGGKPASPATPITRPEIPGLTLENAAAPAAETAASAPATSTAEVSAPAASTAAASAEPAAPVEADSPAAKARGEAAAAKAEPAMQVMRLNLRYNEKTGEYETSELAKETADSHGDGLRFGSKYDVRSGRFRGDGKAENRK